MAATWRVKVGNNLSKSYTVEQLQQKCNKGAVARDSLCTVDDGKSFVSLAELIAVLETPGPAPPAPKKLRRARPAAMVSAANSVAQTVEDSARNSANEILEGLYAETDGLVDLDEQPAPPPPVFDMPLEYEDPYRPSRPVSQATGQARVSVTEAAAQAVASETGAGSRPPVDLEKVRPGQRPGAVETEPTAHAKPEESIGAAGKVTLRRIVGAATIVLGALSIGLLVWWFGSGDPPSVQDLTGGTFTLADIDSDESLSLEQLNARTQIMGLQLNRVARALSNRDAEEPPLDIPELSLTPSSLPLMPFHRAPLTDAEQGRSDDFKSRYSKLVQQQGPSGSSMDEATVSRFYGYLNHLAVHSSSEGNDRTEALYKLSEWTKLIYLLETGRLSSNESSVVAKAKAEILESSNAGLARIYPELQSGDMRYVDVFDRSEPADQARLLLVRYWYYRAANPKGAEVWLQDSLRLIDESQHDAVKASIGEVNRIETAG